MSYSITPTSPRIIPRLDVIRESNINRSRLALDRQVPLTAAELGRDDDRVFRRGGAGGDGEGGLFCASG